MITWMLGCMAAAALVGAAALALDEAARLLGRPRRWGWGVALLAGAGLPLAFRLVPRLPAPGSVSGAEMLHPELLAELLARGVVADRTGASLQAALTSAAADDLLRGAWLLGTAAALLWIALVYRRLRRLRAEGAPVEIAGVPARITPATGPMVVGVRRPEVVVPRWIITLPEAERRMVVRHEWEHVRAGDSRLLLVGGLLVALTPWNLPLWWMQRRLRQAVEVDCDARVLADGADRRVYGSMLIQTAGRPGASSLLAPALIQFPSLLERRIVAMTAKTPRRAALRLVPLLVVGGALLAAACELTPRASPLGPTEPTLADILEPADSAVNERVVIRFVPGAGDSVGGDTPRLGFRGARDGEISIVRLGPGGDTVPTPGQRIRIDPLSAGGEKPLYIVDGGRVASIEGLAPERIAMVEVIKGQGAVEKFGPEAADGVVQITTKEKAAADGGVTRPGRMPPVRAHVGPDLSPRDRLLIRTPGGPGTTPLYFVDGERVSSLEGIEPSRIASVEVLKGAAATGAYGPEAKDGAVLITLK